MPIKINFDHQGNNVNKGRNNEELENKKVNFKLLTVFASVFAFIILTLVIITIFFGYNRSNQPEENGQTPTPTPNINQEINSPSNYATDSALLQIEQNVDKIEIELLETDLKEANLNLPSLNMEIEFED